MDMHQLEEVGTEAQQFAELSVERTWRTVAKGKSSAWTALYAYITGLHSTIQYYNTIHIYTFQNKLPSEGRLQRFRGLLCYVATKLHYEVTSD